MPSLELRKPEYDSFREGISRFCSSDSLQELQIDKIIVEKGLEEGVLSEVLVDSFLINFKSLVTYFIHYYTQL